MELTAKKECRNSNFEILRIIAMLMIFLHHAVIHGGTAFYGTGDFQDYIRELYFHFGKYGVDIFVLISSYCIVGKGFKWRKVIKLGIEILLFNICFLIYRQIKEPGVIVYSELLPFSSNSYWFITSYLFYLMTTPLLNIVLKNIDKKTHIVILCVLTYFISIVPVCFKLFPYNASYVVFIYLFFIASFIKLYPIRINKWWKHLLPLIALIIYCVFNYLLIYYRNNMETKELMNRIYYDLYSPVTIIFCTLVVIYVTNLKPHHSKFINFISLGVLEIYLLHDNSYMRKVIFKLGIDSAKIPYSTTWWIKFLGVNLLKFVIIFVIALAIKVILNFTINKLVDFICDKINKKKIKEEIDINNNKIA